MASKQQVIDLNKKYPDLTSSQIAERLGCDAAYVRATFYRNGLKFKLSTGQTKRQLQPRAAVSAR